MQLIVLKKDFFKFMINNFNGKTMEHLRTKIIMLKIIKNM